MNEKGIIVRETSVSGLSVFKVVNTYLPEILSSQDYYPFGMVEPGRSYTLTNFNYGFNNKLNDNEIEGNFDWQDYGMREYLPRLGKFVSVDPLSRSFPWNSPYSFAEGDVTRSVDLDGLEKINVVSNSFAPYDWFGFDGSGSYAGDGNKRKFDGKGSYRISGSVAINLSTFEQINENAGLTLSFYHRYPVSGKPTLPDYSKKSPSYVDYSYHGDPISKIAIVDFHVYGCDRAVNISNVPVPKSLIPDIDVKVSVQFNQLSKNDFLVTGHVNGDDFPSNETYLTDEKGNKLFLGASGPGAGKDSGPYTMLWGDNNRRMSDFSFILSFNDDNSFKEVTTLSGKTYPFDMWNMFFSNLDPQSSSTHTTSENTGNCGNTGSAGNSENSETNCDNSNN